jgi:hypothetical protein
MQMIGVFLAVLAMVRLCMYLRYGWKEQATRDLHHAETILRFVVHKCKTGLAHLFGELAEDIEEVLCKRLKYAPSLSVLSTRLRVATKARQMRIRQAARSQPGTRVRTGHFTALGRTGNVAGRLAGNLSLGIRGREHRTLTVPYIRRTATDVFAVPPPEESVRTCEGRVRRVLRRCPIEEKGV